MDFKNALQRRILALYIAFFVAIVASCCIGTFGSDFAKGLRDGYRIGDQIANEQAEGNEAYWIEFLYDLPSAEVEMSTTLDSPTLPDGVRLKARINRLDLMLENNNPTLDKSDWESLTSLTGSPVVFACTWLVVICNIVIVVMMFLIIRSLRRSIRGESVFDRKNFIRTRIIGALLIVCSLLNALGRYLTIKGAAKLLEGSAIALDTSFSINFWDVLMGIMILLIAEAFAIGYDMTQEQKLTI